VDFSRLPVALQRFFVTLIVRFFIFVWAHEIRGYGMVVSNQAHPHDQPEFFF
jgi:hypothetical protein